MLLARGLSSRCVLVAPHSARSARREAHFRLWRECTERSFTAPPLRATTCKGSAGGRGRRGLSTAAFTAARSCQNSSVVLRRRLFCSTRSSRHPRDGRGGRKSVIKKGGGPGSESGESFLVPFGKAAGLLLVLGAGVRLAKPLALLLSKPVFVIGAATAGMTVALKRGMGLTWSRAALGSLSVGVVGIGLLAYDNSRPRKATSGLCLDSTRQLQFTRRAISALESRTGSPVKWPGKYPSQALDGRSQAASILESIDDKGRPIATLSVAVTDIYSNGQLRNGQLTIRIVYDYTIWPLLRDWSLESVWVDIHAPDGKEESTVRVQILPHAEGTSATPNLSSTMHKESPSLFLAGAQRGGRE